MKPFLIWTVITLIVFGTCGAAYHLYLEKHPRKVLVAIDSSFPMKAAWSRVPKVLETIADQRYATFSVVTEKNRIHSWSPALKLGTIVPYAPRDLSNLLDETKYPEIREATEKYLLSNMEASQHANFPGWILIHLQ